jgi:hypothetical protein
MELAIIVFVAVWLAVGLIGAVPMSPQLKWVLPAVCYAIGLVVLLLGLHALGRLTHG